MGEDGTPFIHQPAGWPILAEIFRLVDCRGEIVIAPKQSAFVSLSVIPAGNPLLPFHPPGNELTATVH